MNLTGVIPILPTPFAKDESIDFEQIPALVDFAIQSRVAAIGVPAFGSEFYKLSGVERTQLIEAVIGHVSGRLPVIVQCNHTSPQVTAAMAREAERMGASVINTAIPRAFPASERQLLDYAASVCESMRLPVILQDWNPGGPTIGLEFVTKLSRQCANFVGVKYEEPGIGPLVEAIAAETEGRVRTYSGWGGSFMLEMIPAGSVGIMPGLPLVDYFSKIWSCIENASMGEAYRLFSRIAPYITFSLQNLEQFHHVEKHLLRRRGLLKEPVVRSVSVELDPHASRYMHLLLDATCQAIEEAGLPVRIH